jgi:hypothetical protein
MAQTAGRTAYRRFVDRMAERINRNPSDVLRELDALADIFEALKRSTVLTPEQTVRLDAAVRVGCEAHD